MLVAIENMEPSPAKLSMRIDFEFHRTIWSCCDNEYLEKIIDQPDCSTGSHIQSVHDCIVRSLSSSFRTARYSILSATAHKNRRNQLRGDCMISGIFSSGSGTPSVRPLGSLIFEWWFVTLVGSSFLPAQRQPSTQRRWVQTSYLDFADGMLVDGGATTTSLRTAVSSLSTDGISMGTETSTSCCLAAMTLIQGSDPTSFGVTRSFAQHRK